MPHALTVEQWEQRVVHIKYWTIPVLSWFESARLFCVSEVDIALECTSTFASIKYVNRYSTRPTSVSTYLDAILVSSPGVYTRISKWTHKMYFIKYHCMGCLGMGLFAKTDLLSSVFRHLLLLQKKTTYTDLVRDIRSVAIV